MLNTVLASALAAVLLAPAQAGNLAGVWSLDRDESDDVAAMMEDAMRRGAERTGRGRGRGGRIRDRMAGRMRGGGMGDGERGALVAQPESLEIEVEGNEIRIHAGEELQILYLDGEEHVRQDRRGNSIRTRAEMSGDILQVTEKRELQMGELETFRTMQASEDALVVRVQIEPPRGDTINVRTVYRRDQ